MLSNGKAVICYNPTNKPRDILRISVSEDGGETWPHYKVIIKFVVVTNYRSYSRKFSWGPIFADGQSSKFLQLIMPIVYCTIMLISWV